MIEIVDEVRRAVERGYREVVLCGIHLGLYGQKHETRAIKQGINLVELLRKIIKIEQVQKFLMVAGG